MTTSITLPLPDGSLETLALNPTGPWRKPTELLRSRKVYAAAHVTPKVLGNNTPGAPADIDWDSTLAFRRELWSWGVGIADAMDTAQRGMGLDWAATQELISRSAAEAANIATPERTVRDLLACGAGTDQLDPATVEAGEAGLAAVLAAYREQIAAVEASGAKVIIMASRALAKVAAGPEDYLALYGTLLSEVKEPVVLHWLGTMFDPALAGYWGSDDVAAATATFQQLIATHAAKVDGVKVSLLDAGHEVALRASLPAGVRLYTGDDFNYPELIDGDGENYSDALLGIFAAIAPAASAALQEYDAGRPAEARAILDSTRDLGLHIFEAPTYYYKTGVAFLAWLNGFQPGFQMIGGLHSGRDINHLVKLFRLANTAGLLLQPELAASRMAGFLNAAGIPSRISSLEEVSA
ncbi:dihydrodipicolinate synthase family protein [Arthrobacter psychrolactophilus]|uniref:Dihydrodipicolinate synthase family protein n=1 Tax=Arthrobacter psychrolactophilus TaxID=92442 RepID=A0A2V5IPI1_9MICC|nr:dihydrodipicolinate synthase family protein [Arthrobacter psychrolactophilus]PYI38508.1 dihydrodipicolinate synthase family protein [Arthrobacter psychrolactophilus]